MVHQRKKEEKRDIWDEREPEGIASKIQMMKNYGIEREEEIFQDDEE